MAKLNQILMGLALLLCAAPLAAQPCYVQLDDATGLPLPPAQLAELEAAACELRAAFPAEFQGDFAVYDFGFYLHQEEYEGGMPGVFQAKVAEVSSQSAAYLLFGHEVSRDGGSVRLWASFSFASEDYECLDAGVLDAAIKGIAGGQGDRAAAHAKRLEILASLSAHLTEGFCCSAYYSSQEGRDGSGRPGLRGGGGEVCVDFEKVDAAAQALLDDEVYIAFLDKIRAIAAFYQLCANQQWQPGAKDGIIPKCVWEDVPVSIPYTYLDLPFDCGATDGLYSEVEGLADFLLSLDDFASEISKVICSYTVWYLACEKGQAALSLTEFNALMDYLKNASWLSPQNAWVFSQAYDLLERGASGVMWIAGWDCEALEKTRNTIEKLYEAITQKETWVGIYRGMIEQALGIVDNMSGFSNEERYYQGYYGTKVAINFLPGLALTKSKYLNGLSGFLDNLSVRVSNNSSSYGFKLKKTLFDSRKARLKAQAPIKNWPDSKQTQFFNDFPDYDKLKMVDKEGVVRAWEKLSFHDVRLNTEFLEKVSNLSSTKQNEVRSLYMNLKHPAGFKNKVDYDANINGTIVRFDKEGFPDFTVHSPGAQYKFSQSNYPEGFNRLAGDGTDFTKANNWAVTSNLPGFQKLPNGQCKINGVIHTWHHHQDGRTLFPVPSHLHNVTNHSGGKAVLDKGLEDLFAPPSF